MKNVVSYIAKTDSWTERFQVMVEKGDKGIHPTTGQERVRLSEFHASIEGPKNQNSVGCNHELSHFFGATSP